jgi:hypothetical protein
MRAANDNQKIPNNRAKRGGEFYVKLFKDYFLMLERKYPGGRIF